MKNYDVIHLAYAIDSNISILHTFEAENLLHLDNSLKCENGETLDICYPNQSITKSLITNTSDN